MYLFQRRLPLCSVMMNVIYIPLCIYFNRYYYLFAKFFALIYIPLCIYFNKGHWFFRQRYTSIYIPLCIYFNIPEDHIFREVVSFTFHYVSISTCECINHSIYVILFTFHYVSISTASRLVVKLYFYGFTFHYVSISTCPAVGSIPACIIIYIPLCIYFNLWSSRIYNK